MRCHPTECQWSKPWGEGVHGKTRCTKPPTPRPRPGFEYHAGWRFSTTLGGPCVAVERPSQLSLFGGDE